MKTSLPVSERMGCAKTDPSRELASILDPKRAVPRPGLEARRQGKNERGDEQTSHGGLIKGLTAFATLGLF